MAQVKVSRWGSKKRPAASLKRQRCAWGGFEQTLLSFVSTSSQMLDVWKGVVQRHHQYGDVVRNDYVIEIPGVTPEDLTAMALKTYSSNQEELKEAEEFFEKLGIHVTLMDGDPVGVFAELRILSDSVQIRDA
jgi:hypothetical protein